MKDERSLLRLLFLRKLTLVRYSQESSSARKQALRGEDEVLYGPEAKQATVDCEKSDALEDLDDYENFWSCEIVLKDGSGRVTNCWADRKSTDSTFGSLTKTCEEWAAELRSASR